MSTLQWSPVLETGNTLPPQLPLLSAWWAAMEPGLRDREYRDVGHRLLDRLSAAMEPGLRDREYRLSSMSLSSRESGCNGARS